MQPHQSLVLASTYPNPESFLDTIWGTAFPQILAFAGAVLGVIVVGYIIRSFAGRL